MIARTFHVVTVVAGRYRLLTRIGQGGMGVVWRAHDELLRRDVAVKELHVRVGVDSDFHTKQVLREARAAARLRHPGVVAVHDVVVDDGRPLILMELIEGQSLADMIRTHGPLSEQRVAEIGARLLDALSVAHAQGVVHRDVKPGNILLNGDRVVLTDFGIAASSTDTTSSEAMVGSLDYMAPERVNGQTATPASDVWSLGVTLCTALRGESPFQRSDTQATLAAVLTYEPTAIPQAPRLWRVLSMLLNKDPRHRLNASAASAMLAAIAGVTRTPGEAASEPVGEPNTARVVERTSLPPNGQVNGHSHGHLNGRPSGPVLAPLPDSTTGSRVRRARAKLASRARRRLGILLAVLVLIVGAGVWMVVRPIDGVAGTATSATPKTPVPPGFSLHRGDGFTLAVPKGWVKDGADHDIVWLSDRLSPRITVVHIEWWDDASPGGAYKVLTDLERTDFRNVDVITRYERVKLSKASAARGMTSAELEVRYHVDEDGGFDLHERMRSFVTETGRTYILTIAAQDLNRPAAERLWRAEQDQLNTILDGFRITS
jgi:predicted Ser/Thr protein kinase